jgi:protein-S-isoprenylcysteine O-methyltransferase Ste14
MNSELIFQLGGIVIFLSALSISAHYRRKAAQAGNERISKREEGLLVLILLRLAGLGIWFGTLAYLLNPAWMRWSQIDLPMAWRWAGVALALAMLPFIYWLFSSLGNNITDTVAIRKGHTLVTRGPYRWMRHPLYTFGALLFVGFSLIAANGFIAAAGLLGFVMLAIRTPNEEAHLIEKFGDEYRAYMRRTARYLPRLTRGS